MGDKDIGGKYLIDRDPEGWVRWLLNDPTLDLVQILSSDFQFVARASDSLLEVRRADKHFGVLAELQLYYDDDMPERIYVYTGLARQKFDLPIVPVIVYMIPPGEDQEISTAYHEEFMALVSHQDFHVIKLWELNAAEVLAANAPASLLPYIPLMAGANEEMLRSCVQRIRQEPDREQLETILALFAMITMDQNVVDRVARWSMTVLEKSPIYREILQKGISIGRGEDHEDLLKTLRQILHRRLGPAPLNLPERLNDLTWEQLQVLIVEAATAAAWDEFLVRLDEMN